MIRADLIRDYRPQIDQLSYATGRVVPMPTTRAFYAGRVQLTCEYELFDTDTAPNRVLKAAAQAVIRNPSGSDDVRKQARRLLAAMDEVGPMRHGDLSARPDARAAHYDAALTLARNILARQLRSPEHGTYVGWSFLVRTPELVEAGIRHVLADRVRGSHVVSKSGIQLAGSKMRLTPDLVINGGNFVGDVKYKLFTGSWNRSDLYQLVAFATGFRTRHAALVCFDGRETSDPPADLSVGDISLRVLRWRCGGDLTPAAAAAALGDQFIEWIDTSTASHAHGFGVPTRARTA